MLHEPRVLLMRAYRILDSISLGKADELSDAEVDELRWDITEYLEEAVEEE